MDKQYPGVRDLRSQNDYDKQILDAKMIKQKVMKGLLISTLFLLIFVITCGYVIFSLCRYGINLKSFIISFVVCATFGAIPLCFIIKEIRIIYKINKGDFVVFEDGLADKEIVRSHDSEGQNHTTYKLYFFKYFKKYDKSINVDYKVYEKSCIGDFFYIVICNKQVFVFNEKEYQLDASIPIISIEETENYFKRKKNRKIEEIIDEIPLVDNKYIRKDIFDSSRKGTFMMLFISDLFLIGMLAGIIAFSENISIMACIVVFIMLLAFVGVTVIQIRRLYKILKDLKNEHYCILIDNVVSLNNNVEFKDSNDITSFKFKKCGYTVFEKKKKFKNVNIGDEFYLVFINSMKEPIKVYRKADTELDYDVKVKLIK